MPTLTVTREQLVQDWGLPHPWGTQKKVEVLQNTLSGSTRWSLQYELIFKVVETGKIYLTYYFIGATECQDEEPWEYDKEITLIEVEPYEKTITSYRSVKD